MDDMQPNDAMAVDDNETPQADPPMAPEAFVDMVTQAQNLARDMTDLELTRVARQVLEDFDLDKDSMSDWLDQMKRGIDLAKLVKAEKTYPFKRASNVKYPLVTSAALQFNARAYPAIVPSDQVVRAAVFGEDAQGLKAARGERIAAHMSWQLTSQMEEWEEDTDKLLLQLPIVGTMVRKVWYDPVQKRPRSRLLEPGAFVINDKVKTLTDAPRASEELSLYPSEIATRVKSGQFVECDYDEGQDKQEAQMFIEQHCLLDLDEDGISEPYIVTVHRDTEKVVRVVADFEPTDVKYSTEPRMQMMTGEMGMPPGQMMQHEVVTGITAINRGSYFIAYKFMPGIDGGFHGTGLGLLLGDISDTINTIINLMLDAGHMASLGGGFIGSEFRIKGGNQRFEPGEWKMMSATGNDMRSSIVPMTFPGPDAVLLQMLGMLIEAGKEISSTKDIMTGDNGGQVQTATTTLALIEQGMMVFSAAYKRIFRALRREYTLLAKINSRTVDPQQYNAFHDIVDAQGQPVMFDPAAEYGAADMDIQPVADPRSVTKMQEMAKANMLMQMAQQGLIDPQAAGKRVLEAAAIGNIEELSPKPDPQKAQQQAQMEQFQMNMAMEMARAKLVETMADVELTLAKIETEKANMIKTMSEADAKHATIRLDRMTLMLEERRNGLEQAINAGTMGGMAGQSGNADGPVSLVGYDTSPAPSRNGGVLGGQPMAGIGAPGAFPNGGVA